MTYNVRNFSDINVIVMRALCMQQNQFSKLVKSSKAPKTVNSLVGTNSEWLGLCPNLVYLLRFLAKYVGTRFHASHPQKVHDPNGLLAHREIATMVNMVQVVSGTKAKYSGARPGTIAPFNVFKCAIRHPAVAGQVRLHPLCCSVL